MRSFDLSPLFRSTVGFDRLFDMLDQAADTGNGYPPYNIERTDETQYRISVAVAGFAEKDLNVEVRDGVLSVTGKREDADKPELSVSGHRRPRLRAPLPARRACRGSRPRSSRTACSTSTWSASSPRRRSPAASRSTRRS